MQTVELITGRRVAKTRESLGQPQTAVARSLDVTTPVVNKIEHARSRVSIERICQVALALGVEPGSLLPTLAELRGLIGMGGIETLTKIETPTGQEYVDAVLAGARAYIAAHRARPRIDGGDASEYVGFAVRWDAIDSALRKGSNGVAPCGGLHGLLDQHGIGKRRKRL